jgi:sec-independent protein translocase protein TatC
MLGTGEMLVIAVEAIGEFKQMSGDVKRSFEREAEAADFEKRKAEAHEQLYGEKPAAPTNEAPADTVAETPEEAVAQHEAETPVAPAEAEAFARAEEAIATEEPAPAPSVEASALPTASVEDSVVAASPAEPAPSAEPPAMAAPSEVLAELPAESATQLPAEAASAAPPAEFTPAEPPADGPPPPPLGGDESVGEGASARMSLFDHLNDLRKRLTRAVVAVLVGFLLCYAFAGHMLKILMQPMLNALKQSHFIYTLPTEAFFAEMWIAFLAGIFVASPYIFYQVWSFVAPGLYSHERRWIIPIALCSAFFFVSGALFGYFVVFPFGFEFFASYASDILQFTPKLDEYLGFALKLLFAFGIVFELPLFIFFLARLGIVSHVGLRAKRKYAVLGAFIVSAALTPPDAISQTMMAIPLCLLYEVGIWGAYFFGKKKPAPEEPSEAAQA